MDIYKNELGTMFRKAYFKTFLPFQNDQHMSNFDLLIFWVNWNFRYIYNSEIVFSREKYEWWFETGKGGMILVKLTVLAY